MAKPSNRDKILTEGMRVVHERGFANASVRDIVQAAGVPQGSFTNHFASKEAFGLEIIDLYGDQACALVQDTLLNEALEPLRRLEAYIDANRAELLKGGVEHGCLLGNFTAEASDLSESIRLRLEQKFARIRAAIRACLEAAVASGALPRDFDCAEIAVFIHASLQGATLMAKADRAPEPLDRFKHVLFTKILR